MSELEESVKHFRSDLLARDAATLKRMRLAYVTAMNGLTRDLQRAMDTIRLLQRSGEPVPTWRLLQEQRIRELLARSEQEFQKFTAKADAETFRAQQDAIERAQREAARLIEAGFGRPPSGAALPVNLLPRQALIEVQAALHADAPLGRLFDAFAGSARQAVEAELVQGMAAGKQPSEIGRAINRRLRTDQLGRAQTIARTETMRAYRAATQRTFEENEHLVLGWRWYSGMNTRTCVVCLAKHGQFFPVSVQMATHPNCRCVMMPETKTWEELGFAGVPDTGTVPRFGPHVFREWDEDRQRAVLGPGAFRAYQAGRVDLVDFVGTTFDPVWGVGTRRESLRHALSNAQSRGFGPSAPPAPRRRAPRPRATPKPTPPPPPAPPPTPQAIPVPRTAVAPPEVMPPVPTIRSRGDFFSFMDDLGFRVTQPASGVTVKLMDRVAKAYHRELAAGHPMPRDLVFNRSEGGSLATYNRSYTRDGTRQTEYLAFAYDSPSWKDLEATVTEQSRMGWWAADMPDYPVIHELGHYWHFQNITEDTATFSTFTVTRSGQTYSQNRMTTDDQDVARRVSRYGATNPLEFVAETYTGLRSGKVYDDDVMAMYERFGGPAIPGRVAERRTA